MPGKFTVGDIVDNYCIPIKNDEFSVEEDGSKTLLKIAGVIGLGMQLAQLDVPLGYIVDDRGDVAVICGQTPLRPPHREYEQKPCDDVSGVDTPPTPPPTVSPWWR